MVCFCEEIKMCMGDFIGVVVAACRGAIYRALIWQCGVAGHR